MGDIIDLKQPSGQVGNGFAFQPDVILEEAKGAYEQVVVVGFDASGEISIRSSHGSHEALWILRRGEYHLLFETE